jgi:pentatricopeptide repeat protein
MDSRVDDCLEFPADGGQDWGDMDETAQFILEFATADEVAVVVDLLPKVLPNVRSSRSISAAFRCLGKHGRHETALQCFAILKEKGMQSLVVSLL